MKLNTVSKVILIIIMIGAGGCFFWHLRNVKVQEMINQERLAVREVIQNTIREQADLNLLLPEIVFINAGGDNKIKIQDSIVSQISRVLAERYSGKAVDIKKTLQITPFFVFPDKPDKNGRYMLTESQLLDLKNHLLFLTSQVDKSVTATKEEFDRDLNRLNTWVSIWIGVIGFLGIFIPILLNINIASQAQKAEETAIKAVGKIETAMTDSSLAISQANEAKQDSKKALKLLLLVNEIGKLKDIDFSSLRYISEPLMAIIGVLKEMHKELDKCVDDFDHHIVKDSLRQLGIKLHFISFFKFVDRSSIEPITKFSESVSESFKVQFTQEAFRTILKNLNTLITALEENSKKKEAEEKEKEEEKKEAEGKRKAEEKKEGEGEKAVEEKKEGEGEKPM